MMTGTASPSPSPAETRERRDAKREAIVAAARETFLARGFDGASMDQIALSAQVSKRTVYNRFRSKEELFGAAIEQTCEEILPLDIDEIEASLPPREFIAALSRRFAGAIMAREPLALRRIAAFEAERAPAIGEAYLEHGPLLMARLCAPILERIAPRGDLEIDDPLEAIFRLGALITEPLYSKVQLGVVPDDLSAAIDEQVARGLDAFFRIYARL